MKMNETFREMIQLTLIRKALLASEKLSQTRIVHIGEIHDLGQHNFHKPRADKLSGYMHRLKC